MVDIVTVIVGNVLRAGGSVMVVDNLDSTDSTAALSANQGKVLAAQIAAGGGGGAVSKVNGQTGIVVLVKADIGLGNVDNTSDANKPVSTAQAAAISTKANSASLSAVATSGVYSDLSNKPQIVVQSTMPSDISGYPDGTIFIIG